MNSFNVHKSRNPDHIKTEKTLLERYEVGDPKAVTDIIKQYDTLVKRHVRLYSHNHRLDFDDLIQEARLGLMHAIKKYNPDLETSFMSYAIKWIYSYMGHFKDKNVRTIRLNYHARRKWRLMQNPKTRHKFSEKEIADYKLIMNALCIPIHSLNDNENLSSRLCDTDAKTPEENTAQIIARQKILEAINQLNDCMKQIIIDYYWHELTQDEISHSLMERGFTEKKLSRSRIQQLQKEALKKLENILQQAV